MFLIPSEPHNCFGIYYSEFIIPTSYEEKEVQELGFSWSYIASNLS